MGAFPVQPLSPFRDWKKPETISGNVLEYTLFIGPV
jgi:hypothetical protein